jgi:hypothetical protein
VDFVQYVGSRNAYEVDLLPLKSIGNDLYRLPGKKPSLIRTDVAKLGRLLTEYVPERDAYRVNPDDLLPTGGRKVENPSVTEQGLAEYAELKATLLREAALLGVAGTAVSLPFFGAAAPSPPSVFSSSAIVRSLHGQVQIEALAGVGGGGVGEIELRPHVVGQPRRPFGGASHRYRPQERRHGRRCPKRVAAPFSNRDCVMPRASSGSESALAF